MYILIKSESSQLYMDNIVYIYISNLVNTFSVSEITFIRYGQSHKIGKQNNLSHGIWDQVTKGPQKG